MGHPKALLRFGNEVLLQRVVRILSPVASPIMVVAASGQDLPALPVEVLIARDEEEGRGPLQGLAAGLRSLPESVDLVFATATDIPFLKPEWVGRLVEHANGADLVIPFVGGHLHPLAALYRRASVLPAIDRLLAEGRLRLGALRQEVRSVELKDWVFDDIDPDLDTLRNVNTPEEYAQALARAGLANPFAPERNGLHED